MRIGVLSSMVPLVDGGGRFIVEWLAQHLTQAGHEVETILLPFEDSPHALIRQMTAFRLLDLDVCDRVITVRPPAHLIRHRHKIVWFIHHLRMLYDLWDTPYCNVPHTRPGESLRAAVRSADARALGEARRVFTNSRVVRDRLRAFNGIDATVLYPPVAAPERFSCAGWGDEIVLVCRISAHKRQHLALEAMRFVETPVRLRIAGTGPELDYVARLRELAAHEAVRERVHLDIRWISEDEKAALLSTALACAYTAFDEDSYGYSTIEAAHARKATVACADGGGVREFIVDGSNGLIVEPEPRALAAAFDLLWRDRALARRLGEAAAQRIDALAISWKTVLDGMLS
jgi:glycosyltransferase involved in cell wall biosynthesis